MNEPSEEQATVISFLLQGKNVCVDASAGSGKSYTILSYAKRIPEYKILQLTYNSQLRADVDEKIKELELKNINVHTYHSLAVKYYFPEAFDDTGIRKILRENMILKQIPTIHKLVLDEVQDMTYLYYHFMVKFMKDLGQPFQLLVLGDKKQGLYEFKGADIRFLTMAQHCWEKHPFLESKEFVYCDLKTSYRVTQQMANFVNQTMLGETRLLAPRQGNPVVYFRRERRMLENIVINQIRKLIENGDAEYGDIFILGGSVKSSTNIIRRIENALVESEIPCYVPMMESQDQLDNRVIQGKVVFSTFHSVKGRQRKYVFVIGFDQTYFDYYGRDFPIDECPNTLYVGCTRATHGLYILETKDPKSHTESGTGISRPLSFLKMNHLEMIESDFIIFHGDPFMMCPVQNEDDSNSNNSKTDNRKYETPTSLVRFMSDTVLDLVVPILDKIFVKIDTKQIITNETQQNMDLNIPSVIETKSGYFEEISDLNGIALPIMFYDYLRQEETQTLQKLIIQESRDFKPKKHMYLRQLIEKMPKECETSPDYLYLANLYLATQEKLYSKIKQIQNDEYDWFNDELLELCFDRFDKIVGEDCRVGKWIPEKTIIKSSSDEDHLEIDRILSKYFPDCLYRFTARIDLLTEKNIWELKCTTKISVEHFLQVVIYAWIWKTTYPQQEKQYKLFNVKTGELWELNASMDELTYIMVEMLKGKYANQTRKTDDEFLQEINSI